MDKLSKQIWLINTLTEHPEGCNFSELNRLWLSQNEISHGNPLNRQTLWRWRCTIHNIFHIDILCKNSGGGTLYYINSCKEIYRKDTGLTDGLIGNVMAANCLALAGSLGARIQTERQTGVEHIGSIVNAMSSNSAIWITYRAYSTMQSTTFIIDPYCLKQFQSRWYVVGLSHGYNTPRIYALDRIDRIRPADEPFNEPTAAQPEARKAYFTPDDYFADYFGVILDDSIPLEYIIVRAYAPHDQYLISQPLHSSQREIASTIEYTDFEFHLRPGIEFRMELLHKGTLLEVISPKSLRSEMRTIARQLSNIYKTRK